MSLSTTIGPTLIHRDEQPCVFIPIEARMHPDEWGRTIQALDELFAWLSQRGIDPAGAPFYRYLVIGDMEPDGAKPFFLAVGIPVSEPVDGDGRVMPGTIPGGTYATLTHHGHPDQLAHSTGVLLEWARIEGIDLAVTRKGDDAVWAGRYEFYETDPAVEPDLNAWETTIAMVVDDAEAHPLPEGLSAPARRALAAVGIGTLDELARYTEKDIIALHGMGRTAIPKLSDALAGAGLSFSRP